MTEIPVERTVVDMTTGRIIEKGTATFALLAPRKDLCQTCARDHPDDQPHDATALYYQYAFYGANGRWPNWQDAMAHCTTEIKQSWTDALTKMGVDVEGGGLRPAVAQMQTDDREDAQNA